MGVSYFCLLKPRREWILQAEPFLYRLLIRVFFILFDSYDAHLPASCFPYLSQSIRNLAGEESGSEMGRRQRGVRRPYRQRGASTTFEFHELLMLPDRATPRPGFLSVAFEKFLEASEIFARTCLYCSQRITQALKETPRPIIHLQHHSGF